MDRLRVGALISGRGSNLQALIDAAASPDYPAEVVHVISDRPEAGGLARAQAAGISAQVVDHTDYGADGRERFEAALSASLDSAGVELVCQAGFMRIVSNTFVRRWWNRLINIHPSLLPAFPGLDTHARALEAGVKVTGCTVHFVRRAVDQGPIIGQAAVPVVPGDTADSLAARVLAAEHRLYPHCLRLIADHRVTVIEERVVFDLPHSKDEENQNLMVPS